jgi:hypothetical protein
MMGIVDITRTGRRPSERTLRELRDMHAAMAMPSGMAMPPGMAVP